MSEMCDCRCLLGDPNAPPDHHTPECATRRSPSWTPLDPSVSEYAEKMSQRAVEETVRAVLKKSIASTQSAFIDAVGDREAASEKLFDLVLDPPHEYAAKDGMTHFDLTPGVTKKLKEAGALHPGELPTGRFAYDLVMAHFPDESVKSKVQRIMLHEGKLDSADKSQRITNKIMAFNKGECPPINCDDWDEAVDYLTSPFDTSLIPGSPTKEMARKVLGEQCKHTYTEFDHAVDKVLDEATLSTETLDKLLDLVVSPPSEDPMAWATTDESAYWTVMNYRNKESHCRRSRHEVLLQIADDPGGGFTVADDGGRSWKNFPADHCQAAARWAKRIDSGSERDERTYNAIMKKYPKACISKIHRWFLATGRTETTVNMLDAHGSTWTADKVRAAARHARQLDAKQDEPLEIQPNGTGLYRDANSCNVPADILAVTSKFPAEHVQEVYNQLAFGKCPGEVYAYVSAGGGGAAFERDTWNRAVEAFAKSGLPHNRHVWKMRDKTCDEYFCAKCGSVVESAELTASGIKFLSKIPGTCPGETK